MKLLYVIIAIVIIGGLLVLHHGVSPTSGSVETASPQPNQSQSRSNPQTVKPTIQSASPLQLGLPFDIASLPHPPKSFGLYPFGIKSSEHPEGHAGLNIETSDVTAILAPADMKINTITSPAGRPDEHNVEAEAVNKPYRFEYLRVGSLEAGVQVGAVIKIGQKFAVPGNNHSLGVSMFHFGLLDNQHNALCPDQSFWQPDAWVALNSLLHNSLDDTQHPYRSICYSKEPILANTRHIE